MKIKTENVVGGKLSYDPDSRMIQFFCFFGKKSNVLVFDLLNPTANNDDYSIMKSLINLFESKEEVTPTALKNTGGYDYVLKSLLKGKSFEFVSLKEQTKFIFPKITFNDSRKIKTYNNSNFLIVLSEALGEFNNSVINYIKKSYSKSPNSSPKIML